MKNRDIALKILGYAPPVPAGAYAASDAKLLAAIIKALDDKDNERICFACGEAISVGGYKNANFRIDPKALGL